MRDLNKKLIALYILIFLFLIGRVFIIDFISIGKYTTLINPLFWIFVAILSYLFTQYESNIRMRSKLDIIQSVSIVMIIYSMIYFSLGLVFGYERSPYSHSFTAVLKNLWMFISVIGFQEYVRFQLVKLSPKNLSNYAIITLIFIVADIDFWNFSSKFVSNVELFKYLSQTIIPLVVSNCLFTYLTTVSGNVSSTLYRGIINIMIILLPIFPNINWLIKAMMDIILVIIIALYTNYIDIKSSRILNRRQLKKESVISYIPFVVVLVVVVCFVGGTFKYQPIAVLSDSMSPEFSRGDSVIIEKIDKNKLKNLKKGNILYYSKDGKLIIHRIVTVKYDDVTNKIEVKTKGDNNNTEDPWVITNEEIIGTVKFMIPYIGYPSVLVNEFLK